MTFRFQLLLFCTSVACVALLVFVTQNRLDKFKGNAFMQYFNFKHLKEDDLLNIKDIKYIVKPGCSPSFLIWIVTSYAGDSTARNALRTAYTNEELNKLNITRVFLLGTLNTNNETDVMRISQDSLVTEAHKYNDIVQGNFTDTYKNLTYKHVMGLTWATEECKYKSYIMKMDDDIVVNLYGILQMLKRGDIINDALTGYVFNNMTPVREAKSKWFVSNKQFAAKVYPNFLSGWLYITTSKIAKKLVDQSKLYEQYFWIDDVFITGILRQDLSLKLQRINQFYTTDYRYLDCCIEGKKKHLKCEYIIGPNGGDNNLQLRFKDFAAYCATQCSVRPKKLSVGNTCVAEYKDMSNPRKGIAHVQLIR